MLRNLPDLLYNFSSKPIDPDFLLVKNIWRRAQILTEFRSSILLFTEITVQDGERPEDIAVRYYGNPFYNWTILVANDITDYYAQWPKSVTQLQEFSNQKYENAQATKHYITTEVKDAAQNIIVPAGKIVPQNYQVTYFNGTTTVTASPVASVSNAQYEIELNNEKQKIQIVRPNIIEDFVETYNQILIKGKITEVGLDESTVSM